MKKVLKRSLSVLLAFVLLWGIVPFTGLTSSAANYATGDIIQYGSYPQTKITDASFKAALGELTPDSNSDVILNGIKYRRYTTSNITDFYRYEPISWKVLSNGPDGLFVVAVKVLDCKPYNTAQTSVTWATCTLRTWMNSTFFNIAFSSSEKSKIRSSTLINDANPSYGTPGGIDTTDKVFTLSYYDAVTAQYGFSTSIGSSPTRVSPPSDYAKSLGVSNNGTGSYWWLRTPGGSQDIACGVNDDGSGYHYSVSITNVGVRPALKLNLSSGIFPSNPNNSYALKAVDGATGSPVSGAAVVYDGSAAGTTAADGSFTLTVGNTTDASKQVTLTKSGYSSETRRLYELNPYGLNTVGMTSGVDFSKIFADIQFNKESICGPTVNILGNSFPLFKFDAGLDFGNFSIKSKQNTAEKTVKYIVGIKDGVDISSDDDFNDNYADFKNFFKGFSDGTQYKNYNNYNKIKDKLIKNGGSVGFDADLSVAGYVEFDYSSGYMVFKEGGMVVTAEAKVTQTVPFWGVFYAKFAIGGELEGKLFAVADGSGVLGLNTSLSLAAKPTLGAGIGNSSIACIEAGIDGEIKGTVTLPANSLETALELTLSAQAYISAKLLFLEGKWKTNFPSLELYPDFGQLHNKSIGIQESDLNMIDRGYLQIKSAVKSIGASISETNVYPYGAPKLVKLDNGNIVALWVYDDGLKSDANRTTLYYSIYNGTEWSSPAAVYESGKADFDPEIYTDGTNIFALWRRGTEVFADDISIDEAFTKTQLVYAGFDGTSWSVPTDVGNYSEGKYPILYTIVSNATDVSIAWAENSLNDYTFATGTTKIYKQQMTGGVWGSVTQVAAPTNAGSLAIGYISDALKTVYSTDMDNNTETSGDSEIYIDGTRQTTNTADDVGVTYQNNSFYWVSGGKLTKYGESASALAVEGDYKVISNSTKTAVVYPVSDGFKNELVVSTLSGGVYSNPVPLTAYGKHIADYDAIMDSTGTVIAAMDIDNLSGDPEAYPYTTTDFVVDNIGQTINMGIGGNIDYDGTNVTPGSTVPFTATVTNSGTADINGYTLRVKNTAGTVLSAKVFEGVVAVGETRQATINYTIPAGFTKQELTFEVVAAGDSNAADNMAIVELGYADVAVTGCSFNAGTISATVVNNGCETAQDVNVSVSKFGEPTEQMTSIALGSIAAGETKNISYPVPAGYLPFASAYSSNKFIVEASSSSAEMNLANNTDEAIVSPTPVTSIALSSQTLSLEKNATASLTATVYPSEAYNKTVHWVSDATNIVTVSANGNLTAVEAGTANITAITDDGGFVAQCAVTVSVSVAGVSMTPGSATINVGETITMTYEINPPDSTNPAVTWDSTDKTVATVSSNGVVTATKSGQTSITVTTVNGSFNAECLLTVVNAVKGVTVSDNALALYKDRTKQLYANVTPANADNTSVIWSSSDDEIASVNSAGLITTVNTGTATITARTVDGDYTAQCVVTVGLHVTSVFLSAASVNLVPGLTHQLTATVMPLKSLNKNVEWISTNEGVAAVSAGGLITATGTGSATIIVETADGGFVASCAVTVTNSAAGYALNSHAEYITVNGTVQMAGTFTPVTAVNKTVSWVSSDSTIASVSAAGLVTGLKAGSAVIIATTQDGGYKDYCIVRVVGLAASPGKNAVIDAENGYIYGLAPGLDSLASYVDVTDSTCMLDYVVSGGGFGTQTIVNLKRNGYIIDSYTIVLFGDVNGDGSIDSIDAGNIVDYENYLVTWDISTDSANIKAADLNGDGSIDSMDAGIAVDTENYMVAIDQSTGLVE